jgi:3-oxoacyl-[acyl-carrier-protein] synthase III
MGFGVIGCGAHVPARRVTNAELCRSAPTSDEWIVAHTGIRERRFADPDMVTSDLAVAAARNALADAGCEPEDVDVLVVATSSPDWIQPATACAVHQKLGLGRVPAFDVGAVCTGFVYGLSVVDALLCTRPGYRRALLVGAEMYSKLLDLEDRGSAVFFGDGAGAVVLSDVPAGHGVLGTYLLADGRGTDIVGVPAGGTRRPPSHATVDGREHAFRMQGRRVWEFATQAFPEVVYGALKETDLTMSDVDLFILHQANAVMIEACLRSMGVGLEQTHMTVDRYGNTAAASVPITLHDALAAGRIHRGDVVVLAAVGGGMTAGATVIRWY